MLPQRLVRPALLLFAVLPFLAPTASAGDLSLGLRLGRQSAIHISYRSGYRRHAPQRIWVPGYTTRVERKVFVPGGQRKVWIPPVFETRFDECGQPFRYQVRDGYWKLQHAPGCSKTFYVNVWTPGRWKTY